MTDRAGFRQSDPPTPEQELPHLGSVYGFLAEIGRESLAAAEGTAQPMDFTARLAAMRAAALGSSPS